MTPLGSHAHVAVWTTFVLVAAGCGGQTSLSPTSPSGFGGRGTAGAVISGTVAGLTQPSVSAQLASHSGGTPVTVTVVGTSISTTIDGSGRFRLDNVPPGDVQLRFTATGLDATLTVRGVEAGDRIDIRVRLTDTSVRIEAERRERDDDDDDENDDEDEDEDEDEFEGLVSALSGTCPGITFTLNGVMVRANSTTRFEDGTCAQVRNTAEVEVHGQRQSDGSIQAARIELED